MKNLILISTIFLSLFGNAQNHWFQTYNDSVKLKQDAEKIVTQFRQETKIANASIKLDDWKVVKNTTPYLIYILNKTVNLPFWKEVIPQQKDFFYEVSGGKKQGKEVFGLFFNGFYLVHELGHGLAEGAGKKIDNAYDSEYDANTIAILYWRSSGNKKQLAKCYTYAKKILKHLKNPVPDKENFKEYMTKHYEELSKDPYKYGYIQFSQFVEIYENKALPDFETFIKNYNK
ncbi:MAG: hypothetical protein JST23_07170 [Bacteroidetes bacterium]|nr:hypothetical protein [Bacteroidota bacterium]